ncbi:DNA gyrase subunit A [bacterium (Candidatus Blackallbacteria) CG17_big_fil_post_rev_8_21_14_2_50_48_46]|uniref:DNA gyrase subunit A n=1 Tax=bacterium (Candidatus Blackallbacteria) CG17_big_fil_post_rev_8_21_14_2_50_48_46 TaxID=2014261 RepID=A0A2M7FYI2_9BACT|nr:MAG: DNA gyrase subunit A [bacterium (Candidatus Blackallbacteria) CG18_big_fil_WC_8_21_14_2_50_49_26]PIW14096.1 MAG: DNA gyrase subunit A [bacterium (Candidatus Blackallbacteria) CG17_big_fil_post_rev_8_21_14_2_50_48_46]PIW45826.1 MAG: DNA gyrase subunit A [bacterium (Candidatus Blackallbacteria) CG13_big_fil_rev_8_21_14_2_50_49_14]
MTTDQAPPAEQESSPFVTIQDEMKQSFMDYAMSVIVSRALPDVRDGLKPVHRRILYAMHEMGMTPDKPFKKSARIVGEVLGKYHPHGDSAVYDTMVRMAQPFSLRHMMVDGQGNFGSIDGDSAAAMRYTEARLSKFAMEMLADLDCNTVGFTPNFDGSLEEPIVMPSKAPNLLINGVTGIAVGMATEVAPHNLKEVCEGLVYLIDNPDASILDLMDFIKGPDFPTGGIILGNRGIREAFETGRGKVTMRAVIDFEEGHGRERDRLIVKEIPFQLNKTTLVEHIADLVQTGKLEGIADLRDESDRNGMRICIELKRDANSQVVLNNLYQQTRLQSNYNYNMVALVNNQPRLLSLKDILQEFLKHRIEVIRRRTQFFLDRAEGRAHLVTGFLKVLDNLDAVIETIRASNGTQEAQAALIERFELSERQATAVLEMQLRRLNGLEQKKLETEHSELLLQITDFQHILATPERVATLIREELEKLAANFEDGRRSRLEADPGDFTYEDLIPDEPMVVFMTRQGYIKRSHLDSFEQQKRGGRGVSGIQTRDEDYIAQFAVTNSHDSLLFFTNQGIVYNLKAYEIPETSRQSKGNSVANLLQFREDEEVTAMIPVREFDADKNLVMLTRQGIIKKTPLNAYRNIRRAGLITVNLDEGDVLGWVALTDGQQQILIGTANGMAIKFKEEDVRPTGRTSRGVKAIQLKNDDVVVGMATPQAGQTILTVTNNGYGKRTEIEEYRLQSRAGSGIINIKLRKDGKVASLQAVDGTEELIVVTSQGIVIRQHVRDISVYSRSTKGVMVQRLGEGDKIVAIGLIQEQPEAPESEANTTEGEAAPASETPAVVAAAEPSEVSSENSEN